MIARILKGTAAIVAVAVAFAACEDTGALGPTSGDATLRVLLTDAPAHYIDSAYVDIGAVYLVPPEAEGEDIIQLTDDGTDGMVNLLDLQGDATSLLAEADIESGAYAQLRLMVDSARVVLEEGYEFNDGSVSRSLKVPSGAQTGIKLNLHDYDGEPGVVIAPGETVLVLDFDVSRSFVAQGNPHAGNGIHGMIFKPTIRVTVLDVAGSIAGTVSAADDSIAVDGLTVTADPVEDGSLLEEYQTQVATATTDSTGAYTIFFVVPGDYAVTVGAAEGFVTEPSSRDVTVNEAEAVTGIDFEIVEDTSGEGEGSEG